MKVRDCMCNDVCCITPESSVQECAKLMKDNHCGCLPVCDNTQNVVGLITDRDIILRTVACDKDVKSTPVSEVMSCKVCCCTPDADINEAEHLMSEYQIKRIPVMENNKIVGILTLGDLAANNQVPDNGVANTLNNICNCDSKNAE